MTRAAAPRRFAPGSIHNERRSRTMSIRRITLIAAAAAAAAFLVAGPAAAGPGGQLRIERAWYAGHEVTFLQPSLFSAKPNGGTFLCFGLGPDLSGITRPTAPLYVIVDPTATQDHCDGAPDTLRHDHILSVAPGDPGYTGAWTLDLLVEAVPGMVDLATHPFTTAAQVRDAIAAGVLVDVSSALSPTPVMMVAPVIGGN